VAVRAENCKGRGLYGQRIRMENDISTLENSGEEEGLHGTQKVKEITCTHLTLKINTPRSISCMRARYFSEFIPHIIDRGGRRKRITLVNGYLIRA
jgi:hypothetical protein